MTASLANILAHRGRSLIVDADMGVGNAHILQDVHPERSFVDVVAGEKEVEEIVYACGAQLDLLAAGSGHARMAGLSPNSGPSARFLASFRRSCATLS